MLRSLFRSRKHVRIRNLQKMYAEDVFQSCNSQEPPLKVVDWGLATPSKPFCYIFAPDPLADSDPHSQSNRNELTAMVEASLRLHNRIAHSDSNFGPGAVQHICAVKFENLGVKPGSPRPDPFIPKIPCPKLICSLECPVVHDERDDESVSKNDKQDEDPFLTSFNSTNMHSAAVFSAFIRTTFFIEHIKYFDQTNDVLDQLKSCIVPRYLSNKRRIARRRRNMFLSTLVCDQSVSLNRLTISQLIPGRRRPKRNLESEAAEWLEDTFVAISNTSRREPLDRFSVRRRRENPDFFRITVLELAMKRSGGTVRQRAFYSTYYLPPRSLTYCPCPFSNGPEGSMTSVHYIPRRWRSISASC